MSLNDIHLPLTTVADLYKTVLVSNKGSVMEEKIKDINVSKEIKQTTSINFLGNNNKQIAVIVSYNDAVYMPDDKLSFLTSILTACKLNLDDIALVNFADANKISYKEFLKVIPAKSVLFFGVKQDTLLLPVNFPFFQVQHFDGVEYLSSPPLDEIEKNKTLKGNLWTSLKKIFNL